MLKETVRNEKSFFTVSFYLFENRKTGYNESKIFIQRKESLWE